MPLLVDGEWTVDVPADGADAADRLVQRDGLVRADATGVILTVDLAGPKPPDVAVAHRIADGIVLGKMPRSQGRVGCGCSTPWTTPPGGPGRP